MAKDPHLLAAFLPRRTARTGQVKSIGQKSRTGVTVPEYRIAKSEGARRRESPLPSDTAQRQALSCDPEQLWQKLSDRFGDQPSAAPRNTSVLRGYIVAFTSLDGGCKVTADHGNGSRHHGVGTV